MYNRYVDSDPDIEYPAEIVPVPVVDIRIGQQVIGRQSYTWHHVGAGHRHLPVIDLPCKVQTADFRPCGIDFLVAYLRAYLRYWYPVQLFICQLKVRIQGKTAELAQQHLAQGQTVGRLGQQHGGFIRFHFDRKQVRLRRHTLGNHHFRIVQHHFQQPGILLRKFLLVRDGDNLPVCVVDL